MEYPEGEVFCPICHKKLVDEDDKERGYHFHCEKSEVFTRIKNSIDVYKNNSS
jgi:uncharacterized Zn finger protein (UPF0148 family)